jgi:hypothetical protein
MAETPGKDEAARSSFVTDIEFIELHAEFFGQGTQGAFRGEVAASALSVVSGRASRAGPGVGDRDRFLVNVEADVVFFLHGVVVGSWFIACSTRPRARRLR